MAKKAKAPETTIGTHSPGPWAFKEGDAERRAMSDVFKAADKEFTIAQVNCEWANKAQRAEDIANARLIAAAPDFLAVCTLALAWADRECMPQGGKGDGPWEEIEKAIAKATGK